MPDATPRRVLDVCLTERRTCGVCGLTLLAGTARDGGPERILECVTCGCDVTVLVDRFRVVRPSGPATTPAAGSTS